MAKTHRTQKTQPKQGEPVEIPVPKRRDVLGWLKKAAQGKGGSATRSEGK